MSSIIIIAQVLLAYVSIGFLISIIVQKNYIADVLWGPGIFISVFTAYMLTDKNYILTLIIIFLWALRIFLHIGSRFLSMKEEEFRYATWRSTWKYFYLRSYLQVFLLQGFLMLVVSSSVVIFKTNNLTSNIYVYTLFSALALCALAFEAVADKQLKDFLKLKTGGIMKTGLWSISRHPNYFGEVMFWWCIFISLVPSLNFWMIISPLTITYLILYVSGIPMLEKKYDDNPEFQAYKKITPAFWPRIFR